MTKYRAPIVVALVILAISGTSAAINVDGVKSTGEWNENWSYGQTNGTGYDPNGPFGNKMVVFQGGSWYDEDPDTDAGESFTDNLATVGPEMSGYDLKAIYAHYDPVTDTLYGMATVYGLPGDLDGDGNPGFDPDQSDSMGAVTANGVDGIGPEEFFNIRLIQGSKVSRISIQNNDWTVVDINPLTPTNFTKADVTAANCISDIVDPEVCVYEIEVRNLRDSFNLNPGEMMTVRVTSGAQDDQAPGGGLVGEDIAEIFITIPNPDIDVEKTTNGEDADTAPGPGIIQGDALIWTYIVTNTGNVPLENVVLTDDKLGIINTSLSNGNGDDILDLGETWIYAVEGVAECGQYENNATVVGFFDVIPVFDDDPSHYFGECPDIDIEKATNGEDADTAPGPGILESETVTWTYVVTNTGNVDLTNIQVNDNIIGSINNITDKGDGDNTLAVGEVWTLEATGLAECGQYENNATVTGDSGETTVDDSDMSHYFGECPDIDIEKATNGEDADTAPGPGIPEGESVTWTYVVTNNGNVNLTNIQVADDILGAITNITDKGDGDDILSAGESWTLEATGLAECGQYENNATVTGDYEETTVEDSDMSHYFGECPGIDIEKATNGEDADAAPGPGIPQGDAVTWTYVVTNTGNVGLTNIVVNDDQGLTLVIVSNGNGDNTLDVGETWTYEATGTAECGQYANLADVTGDYEEITVTDEDPSHYFGECPGIDIEKATNGEDADAAPGPGIPQGDAVTWTYVVTNTGNVGLTNIVVNDDQGLTLVIVSNGNGDTTLDVGETWTYEATGTAECGQYANLADVTGDYGETTVTDEDPSHYFGECSGIDIEKATNGVDADTAPGPGIQEGEPVTWTYVVTNTGNVGLTNIVVNDDQGLALVLVNNGNGDETLDVGETWTYEATGTAECGQYANLADVTGDYEETTVTDEDPSHYFGECPGIDIEKATNGEDADTAPGPGIPQGNAVTWTYVVSNTGNLNLTDIQVTDNVLGTITNIIDQSDGDETLAVGESWVLEANGTAECGQYENEVTVTGNAGDNIVEDSDMSHYFGQCPDIDIEKATNGEDADVAPGPSLDVGDTVTWTYVVANMGNIDLINIIVTDDKEGVIANIIDKGDGDETLAVGEVWTYQATGRASCGDYANLGTVTGEDDAGSTVSDEDPSHYNVVCIPRIDIEKTTNGEDADLAPGPTLDYDANVTWEYIIRNTGNVHLTNVTVTDDKIGTITNIVDKGSGDDTLLPGEVWIYQATGKAECGQYANIADVVGYYGAIPVTDNDPSHYNVNCGPDIDIEKYINGKDADNPSGVLLAVGDDIVWTFVVENTGNLPLENIVIDDDKLGVIPVSSIISKSINNDDILDQGEVWTYELSGSVEECVPLHKNIATVSGEFQDTVVTDDDAAHYYCQPVVPVLSPLGMLILIAALGIVGTFYAGRRE